MQKGQALLLVLLSMSVVLVVALSVVSRSVTDISLTSKEESSTRAFNAAESGVERVLVTGSGASGGLGNANFAAGVTTVGKAVTSFSYPTGLNSGESASVWFTSRDQTTGAMICNATNPCYAGNRIEVCWGNKGTDPALEFSYYFATGPLSYATVRNSRSIYDPDGSRIVTNHAFSPDAGACTIGTTNYPHHKTINLGNGNGNMGNGSATTAGTSIVAKIRLLYNASPDEFGVIDRSTPASSFPAQGNLIDSTGSSGDANRRINVFQSIGDTPSVFDNVVYSEGSLSKP